MQNFDEEQAYSADFIYLDEPVLSVFRGCYRGILHGYECDIAFIHKFDAINV